MGIKQLEQFYIKKFKEQEIEEIHRYITSVYDREDGGYVRLFSRLTESWLNLTIESLWNLDNFKKAINYIGKEDAMYSLSLFNSHDTGLKKNIQALRLLAVDIDFKVKGQHKNSNKESILYMLEQDYFNIEIPVPTIIESGNQIRLIYVLEETVGATYNSKRLADRIHKILSGKLIEFGAEVQTLTSYARIPHSINTKTKDVIKITNYSDYRYTLQEIQQEWLDPLPNWYKPYLERRTEKLTKKGKAKSKKKKKSGKVFKIFNPYTFSLGRLQDLETIQEYFNFDLEYDKEYLCFLYRNHCILSGLSKEVAEEKTKAYYLKFKSANEYKWRRIESQTRNVERHTYFIPNHRILEHLGITEEDEENLELVITISKAEKRRRDFGKRKESRRNENGLTSRQQEKEDTISKVKELKEQGLTQKQAAEQLGKGIATIKRYWNK